MRATNEAPGLRVARKIRIRAILFLVLALAAAGGAVFLVKGYLDRAQGLAAAQSVQTQPVVIAAVDIPIATKLTEQHVALAKWPQIHTPEGAFITLPEVLGRTTQQKIVKGEPVIAQRLADPNRGDGLAAILEKGTRAMAVRVDQVVGVAGFVQPGDFVDVITTMTPDEETRRELKMKASAIAKVILQNIKVLTVGEHMATKGSKPVKVQVVTLEVTPDQSERIALASRNGQLQLTMRSRIDPDRIPTEGITPVALLQPDDGFEPKPEAVASAAPAPKPRIKIRYIRRGGDKPKKPAEPVVEVLRGGKIEQRKLRPSADSNRSGN